MCALALSREGCGGRNRRWAGWLETTSGEGFPGVLPRLAVGGPGGEPRKLINKLQFYGNKSFHGTFFYMPGLQYACLYSLKFSVICSQAVLAKLRLVCSTYSRKKISSCLKGMRMPIRGGPFAESKVQEGVFWSSGCK